MKSESYQLTVDQQTFNLSGVFQNDIVNGSTQYTLHLYMNYSAYSKLFDLMKGGHVQDVEDALKNLSEIVKQTSARDVELDIVVWDWIQSYPTNIPSSDVRDTYDTEKGAGWSIGPYFLFTANNGGVAIQWPLWDLLHGITP